MTHPVVGDPVALIEAAIAGTGSPHGGRPAPDALAAARDALHLLQTGGASMALRVLETLPGLIERDLREQSSGAYLRGRSEGELAAARRIQALRPRTPTADAARRECRLNRLRALLADPERRASVREALRLDDRLLDRVAAGTLTLSSQQWRRLRDALP